jgi:hypothetical protein
MRGRGTANGDEFIREVDEAVRQDQWLGLWRRYGTFVMGAAVAIVVGTAVGVVWREYQASQRQAQAQSFAAAEQLLQDDKAGEAATAFAGLADDAGDGYSVLARLRTGQAQAAAEDPAAAGATFAALGASGDAPALYRELAQLLALQRRFETTEPAALLQALTPLLGAENPWRHSAMELQALAQLKANDVAAARQTLAALTKETSAPPALAQRAGDLLASLGGPAQPAAAGAAAAADAPTGTPQAPATEATQ